MPDVERSTGVFICTAEACFGCLDVARLVRSKGHGAAFVGAHGLLCGAEGRAYLTQQVAEQGLEHVVIAACSPKEHGPAFREAVRAGGLDPHQLQRANLRDQCDWNGGDREAVTDKAQALVRGAVARAALHRDLAIEQIDCSPDVLVVGGGVAGISSALQLAQRQRRVVLIDRDFAIGGRAAMLDKVYPTMECASCFMESALDQVLHDPNVQVMTGAEVVEVLGFYGNFTVRVRQRARRVDPDLCLGAGCCSAACPVVVPDEHAGGGATRAAIYMPYKGCLPHVSVVDDAACLHVRDGSCDACVAACPLGAIDLAAQDQVHEIHCGAVVVATGFQPRALDVPAAVADRVVDCFGLERMLHPDGPASGAVVCADGAPPSSVLLAYAGETEADEALGQMELLKLAGALRRKLPAASQVLAVGTCGLPQARARAAADLQREGVAVHRARLVRVEAPPDGRGVSARLEGDGGSWSVRADLVVVYTPSEPRPGARALADALRIGRRKDAFLEDDVGMFEPTATRVAGVYVAGGAGGPRPIAESARDGAAAAARVLSRLVPGEKIALEPLSARIDETLCCGCRTCATACPYRAIVWNEPGGTCQVVTAHCRGCGTCAAACPSGAVSAAHFTYAQIAAEIAGLLAPQD